MASQPHDGRAVLIEKINGQLGVFVNSTQTAIRNNLPNRNVLAESTLKGLLNLIHGWELVNANSIRQNYPGIDLIDTGRRIGVQVTSTNTPEKVKHTLEQVEKLSPAEQVDQLYILTITNEAPTTSMKNRTLGSRFSGSKDIWNIPELLRQMMDLDAARLEAIHAYLEAELGTLHQKLDRRHLALRPVSSIGDGFVGREAELAQIGEKLRGHVKPIVLSGLGGIGKTELAVRFGQTYREGAVYFVRFDTSFTRTLAKMAGGIRPALSQEDLARPDAELCAEVLGILEGCGERDILIIDNVEADSGSLSDLMKDQAYRTLKAMKPGLILTTRFDAARAVGIASMPNQTLYEIFEKHNVLLDQEQMDALIAAVGGHTLTIDLMARTLNGKGWRKVTPEMMLASIQENTLPGDNYKKIATDYNQSEDQAQIYQHLSVVFDANHIPEEHQNVLQCATLIPGGGMDGELFAAPFSEEGQAVLDELIDHGWLTAEDGMVIIHPVIRLVCREELKPSDESCGGFLDDLWDQVDFRKHERSKFEQLAELFALAADALEDQNAHWLNRSSRLWNELRQPKKVTVLYEKHLPSLEQRLPDSDALSTAYNNLGSAYSDLGDYNKALDFKLKALHICEKVLPQNHPNLAASYNNVGTTYGKLGDHEKALEFQLKDLHICETVLPEDHPSLATSYDNVGSTYGDLGDHEKALAFQLKSLHIREKVLPENHPDLATSYNNVGNTYGDLGDHEKALAFKLRDLHICEKVLPEDHPSLAVSYHNVSFTYMQMGRFSDALAFLRKALAIRENALPEGHPGTEDTRYGVALVEKLVSLTEQGRDPQELLKRFGLI